MLNRFPLNNKGARQEATSERPARLAVFAHIDPDLSQNTKTMAPMLVCLIVNVFKVAGCVWCEVSDGQCDSRVRNRMGGPAGRRDTLDQDGLQSDIAKQIAAINMSRSHRFSSCAPWLLHLEVQCEASLMGFSCRELQQVDFLQLQDIKTSAHRDRFPSVAGQVVERVKNNCLQSATVKSGFTK